MLTRLARPVLCSTRNALRPPPNKPFRGIYRTDGEAVCQGELIVCQQNFNYLPGMNISFETDRGQLLLKAACDGVVRITTEEVNRDEMDEDASEVLPPTLSERRKLTFNVLPKRMSQSFKLVTRI